MHRIIVSALVVITGLTVLTFATLPGDTALMREIQNTGHTFVFGVVAVAVLIAAFNTQSISSQKIPVIYAGVFLVCFLAAILVELVQSVTGRDAEVIDVLRDIAGIVAFSGFYFLVSGHWKKCFFHTTPAIVLFTASVSAAVLAAALIPLAKLSLAYVDRESCLPVIYEPGNCSGISERLHNATLEIGMPPVEWGAAAGREVGKVRFNKGEYPGLGIIEPYPDWSSFSMLVIELYSEQARPFSLVLRVHDKAHNFELADRFNQKLDILPGLNVIEISLKQVREAPSSRAMDLTSVAEIILFGTGRQINTELYIGKFWLE